MTQSKKNPKDLLFSQRIGITQIEKAFQLDGIDEDLKIGLWNAFLKYFAGPSRQYQFNAPSIIKTEFMPIYLEIWKHFLKLPLHSLSECYADTIETIRSLFFSWEYNKKYDFIDWIARLDYSEIIDLGGYIEYCNMILERENSGYRFVNGFLKPITNKIEIKEIEEAMANSDKLELVGVHSHIQKALELLSVREKSQNSNSFKESISAVEALCKKIINNPNATLGDALDKIQIHPALKKGYSAIYGYASSDDGIRHGSIDISKVDYDDAKYMLISCSAFINYLVVKAQKGEILKNQNHK